MITGFLVIGTLLLLLGLVARFKVGRLLIELGAAFFSEGTFAGSDDTKPYSLSNFLLLTGTVCYWSALLIFVANFFS
jgi:hypothetical protein